MDRSEQVTPRACRPLNVWFAAALGAAMIGVMPGAPLAQETHTAPHGQSAAPAVPGQPGPLRRSIQFHVGQRNVKALFAEPGITWIGTSGGLIRYQQSGGKYTLYDNKTGLLSNGVFYVGRVRDQIWVGTYGGGLSVYDAEEDDWRNYNIPNGMADAFVYDVLEARNGDIWIATWSGANRIAGGRMDDIGNWQTYTVENTHGGLPNDWVYSLAEGPDGEIWLATEGGLARFAGEKWTHWRHEDGLGAPYRRVAGDIQFQDDPARFSSHHARQKVEQGLQDIKVAYNPNYVIALLVTPAGEVWAGTWGGGLSRFDGRRWQTYTVADGLPGNHVFALGQDPGGDIWAGTSNGLARLDGDSLSIYRRQDGLYSDVVFSIAFGPDGSAWIGGTGGLTWFPRGLATTD